MMSIGLAASIGIGLILLCCSRIVYNLYFHPLAAFPGPKLAAATRWYEACYDILTAQGGQYMYAIEQMHKRYGPLVRIAPNELHVNDPEYRTVLYSVREKRDKVPYMVDIFGTPLAIFGTVEHELHRQRRAALNPFFSRRSIERLEDTIRDKVQKMLARMSEHFRCDQDIPLRNFLTACIVDVTSEFSFGRCAEALEKSDCSPEWNDMMAGVSEAVPIARSFPGVVQLVQRLPVWLVRLLNPLMASYLEFEQMVRQDVNDVFERHAKSRDLSYKTITKTGAPTVFHEILGSGLPPHEKTVDRMTQEGLSVISAASETTSTVIATIVFHVARSKNYMFRLQKELDDNLPQDISNVSWANLEKLPFLAAVVKEGLRVSVPICGRLPLVSREPLQFKKWTIPAGTFVGMSPRDALYHPEIFPTPEEFNPDRWLASPVSSSSVLESEAQAQRMQTAFVPFNRGSRMCIGVNLAYANIFHILAAIFHRFDLAAVDTLFDRDVKILRDYFVSKPDRKSHGISMKVMRDRHIVDTLTGINTERYGCRTTNCVSLTDAENDRYA